MNIIQTIDAEQIAKLTAGKPIPDFAPGDTVRISVNVNYGVPQLADLEATFRPKASCAAAGPPTAKAWNVSSSSTRRPSRKSTYSAAAMSAAPSSTTCAAAAVNPPASPKRPVKSKPRLLSKQARRGGAAPSTPANGRAVGLALIRVMKEGAPPGVSNTWRRPLFHNPLL